MMYNCRPSLVVHQHFYMNGLAVTSCSIVQLSISTYKPSGSICQLSVSFVLCTILHTGLFDMFLFLYIGVTLCTFKTYNVWRYAVRLQP